MSEQRGPTESNVRSILAKGIPMPGHSDHVRQGVDPTIQQAFVALAKNIDEMKVNKTDTRAAIDQPAEPPVRCRVCAITLYEDAAKAGICGDCLSNELFWPAEPEKPATKEAQSSGVAHRNDDALLSHHSVESQLTEAHSAAFIRATVESWAFDAGIATSALPKLIDRLEMVCPKEAPAADPTMPLIPSSLPIGGVEPASIAEIMEGWYSQNRSNFCVANHHRREILAALESHATAREQALREELAHWQKQWKTASDAWTDSRAKDTYIKRLKEDLAAAKETIERLTKLPICQTCGQEFLPIRFRCDNCWPSPHVMQSARTPSKIVEFLRSVQDGASGKWMLANGLGNPGPKAEWTDIIPAVLAKFADTPDEWDATETPVQDKEKADAWVAVYDLCRKIGMPAGYKPTGKKSVLAFIQENVAAKAGHSLANCIERVHRAAAAAKKSVMFWRQSGITCEGHHVTPTEAALFLIPPDLLQPPAALTRERDEAITERDEGDKVMAKLRADLDAAKANITRLIESGDDRVAQIHELEKQLAIALLALAIANGLDYDQSKAIGMGLEFSSDSYNAAGKLLQKFSVPGGKCIADLEKDIAAAKLNSEVPRLKAELQYARDQLDAAKAAFDDPNYQYAGSRIHRKAIECRNDEIDQLRKELNARQSVPSPLNALIERLRDGRAEAVAKSEHPTYAFCGAGIKKNGNFYLLLEDKTGRLGDMEYHDSPSALVAWIDANQPPAEPSDEEKIERLYSAITGSPEWQRIKARLRAKIGGAAK